MTPMRMSSNSRIEPNAIFELPELDWSDGFVPPKRSSAVPIVKPFPRTTRPGITPVGVVSGAIVPRTSNFGNVTLTLSILTSSWFAGPFGSYWTRIPAAVTSTTSVTWTSSARDAEAELARARC